MRSWIARHPISFMALYTVFYLTAFHWLEVNITVPAIWVHCQLDDVIPFCKYAIVPYFAWFAWIPFTLFYLLRHGERSDFWRVCLCLFAGMTIALSCYVLLPTGLALRPYRVYGSDIFARLVRMLYAVDTARNVCPSIHVFNSVTLMIGYRRSRCFDEPGRRWMRPAANVLGAAIILSTMLLKQHSCIDVVLGAALAFALDAAASSLDSLRSSGVIRNQIVWLRFLSLSNPLITNPPYIHCPAVQPVLSACLDKDVRRYSA